MSVETETDQSLLITITMVVVAIIVIVIAAYQVAGSISDTGKTVYANGNQSNSVEQRIQPVGQVRQEGDPAPEIKTKPVIVETKAPAAPEKPLGERIYTSTCFACHGTGAAGAPKTGDQANWTSRIAQGIPTLLDHATHGFKGMPARGGNASLKDNEVKAAIVYMLEKSNVSTTTTKTKPAPAAKAEPAPAAKAEPAPAAKAEPAPAAKAEPAPAAKAEPAPATDDANMLAQGKKVYDVSCFACHGTGAAGAPMLGNKDAWSPRIAKGRATLNEHALKGFNAMPAKGGNPSLSDADVTAAVSYMISNIQ